MKLITVNTKKQGPKGGTGESRLRPNHALTGSHSGPEVGFEEMCYWSPRSPFAVTELLQDLDEDRFELISPPAGPYCSTLIVLRPRKEEAGAWKERLAVAGFDIAVREGNLRISPHLHISHQDIAKLALALSP